MPDKALTLSEEEIDLLLSEEEEESNEEIALSTEGVDFEPGKTTDPVSDTDSGSESGSSVSAQDDLGIPTPVESTSFDQMFSDENQLQTQRYAHIDENTFSSSLVESNVTNREDNLKRKLEEHYKDTDVKFNIESWDGNRIEVVLPGEKKGQFFDLPSDPVEAKEKYLEMVEYMEDRTAVEVGDQTTSEIQELFDFDYKSATAETAGGGLYERVNQDKVQEILGSDYEVNESGFFKNALEITVPGGAKKTFPKSSSSEDILSFMRRNPRSIKQTKVYQAEKKKVTEEAKTDLNEAITKRLDYSAKIDGSTKRTEEEILMLLNNPESFNKMKNDILSDVTSTWWNRNKDNNDLKNLSNSDIDGIRTELVQTALNNHKANLTKRLSSSGKAEYKKKGQTRESVENQQREDHLVGKKPEEIQIAELWDKIKDPKLASEKEANLGFLNTAQILYDEKNASNPYQFNYDVNTLSRPLVLDEKNKDIVNLTAEVQETIAAYEELPADALDGELFDVTIAHDQALREFKTKKIKVPITDFNDEVKYLTAEQKNKYIVDNSRMGLNAKGQSVLIGDRDAYFNVTAEEAASLGLKDPLLRANATFVTDLAVREEALVRLQVLNQRSTTVGKTGLGGALVDSFASSIGIKTDTPKSQLATAMNDAMVDAGVTLTNEEKKMYHKTNGEAVGEALGGLPKLVVDFYFANKAAAGIQTVTGINRVLKALNARRYAKIVKGRKVFVKPPAAIVARGETAVANWATASGVVAKTFAPHIASRAASTAITSIIEGVKMEAVMGPGSFSTGVGFGMAGKLIPWPVIRGSNWGRTLFDYGVKSPINFTIGAEAGEIMTGLTNDVMNKKDFRDFMKEHYSDYSEVGQRTIANLVSGLAMRFSHISKMDFKSTQGVRDIKIEAKKKMDAAREEAALQRALDPTKGQKLGPEQEAFTRAQMVYDLANRRLAELNNTELYLDPVVGPLKLANDLKGSTNKLIKDLGEKGKKIENVRVEYTDERIKGSYRLDGKDLIYTINPKYIEPGVAPHEIGHAGMELLSGKDAILKAEVVEAIDNISKDIIMDDGRTLFESVEGVGKGDRAYDVNRVTLSEKFAYLAEAMNNPQIAKQIRKKYGFDMYGQFITKWSKKNLNADLVFNTEKRVAEWFNNYVETIGKGKSPLRNFEHLQEWISPEATTKQMKAREKWERENYRDKDGSLNSELLNKREQELTQEIDSNLKDFLDKKISKEQYKLKTEDLLKERFKVKELITKGLPQPTEEDAKFEANVESMYSSTKMPKGDRAFFVAEMWDPTGYTNLKTGKKTRYAKNPQEAALYEKTNGEQGFKAMPAGAKALNTVLKKYEAVDGFAENKDLIIEDITTGAGKESKKKGSTKINKARSVRQMVLDYKAVDNPGVPLSGYINNILFGSRKRYIEGVEYYLTDAKIGFRTGMENTKEITGDVNKSTYTTTEKDISQYGDTRVVFELPINNKAFNQKGGWKETILKNLDVTKNKSYKTTPDLAPEFTREMMGVKLSKSQEKNPNDLGQKNLEAIQKFIDAKFMVEKIEVIDGVEQVKIDPKTKLPETREVSMAKTFKALLNEGAVAFDKGVSDALVGTSTGNRKLILKEFYHEATQQELLDLGFKISKKTGRVETAAGQRPFVLNKNITVEQIKKFVGIKPGKNVTLKENRSLAGNGRGVLELFGENVSQQEARLSDKLTVNQMFDMGAGRNRALLSEVLGGETFENQRSFLDKVQSENFARLLEHNKKIYPKDQQKALERTLIDHFAVEKGHDLKNSTLKTIAKELSKEFVNTKIDADKVRVAAAKQIVYTNVLSNIAPTKFELNTPEQIVEAQAVTRVVAKEMIEKYGDGIYELLFASGESGGKGVGPYPSWADAVAGTNKGQNRLALHEVRELAVEFMSDLKNSKGKKFTKYKKALLEGQGDKIGQMNRFIDKKTNEWDMKKLEEAFEVGEFIKTVLKDAVEVLRESHEKGDITANQVRQWVEIHGSPMTGIIKLSASFGIMPNMSVKEMFKLYPERVPKLDKDGKIQRHTKGKNKGEVITESNYVLEHTTPAQYVKARIFDYIINGGGARKTALDLTLRDYHTTLIPKPLDAMVNKILQTNLPSSHLPGMDVMERYYEASHPSDFGFGLKAFAGHRKGKVYDKNITLSAAEKQRRGKELRESLEAAFPSILRKATKNKLNSEILNDMKDIDKALGLGRKRNKDSVGMSTWDFDDTLATTKSGVRARIPNTDGKPKPSRKVIFLAGGAGSGKGNVIKKLNLEGQGFKLVNSDISLEWLKKNNGLPENMNDLTKEQRSKLGSLQHQARGIAKRKMMKYKGNADGVVVDGTGGSIKSMEKLVSEFKEKGYDVSMLFVETSLQTALARNQARSERSLLDKIVEKNHEAVQGNKDGFKKMFGERFMEVQTDKLKQADAMPKDLVTKMKDFVSGYEKIRLDAEQFATEGQSVLNRGGKFDFSEFNVVTEGAKGPFFEKAMARAKKFGTKDQFVLTARPPEAAGPIHEFLKSQGLNIPLKNITGLGNSTGEAKALWMLKKFAEGYNDMYFADDAMQNVKAVRDVLNQLDIKSKVQQALKSEILSDRVNDIMEHSLDIGAKKVFSKAEAKVRGKDIKRRRVFMRDSAADLELLIEPLYGKGKEGIKNKEWFKENLVMPFERGIRDYNTARQSAKNDYMSLRKQNKDVVKEISKPVEGTAFTNDMAMRVYLWNKAGYKIPDLAKTTEAKLVQHIANNPKLQAYAENFARITKQEKGLKEPGENWWGETMAGEVTNINRGVSRKQYLQEWIDVKNEIFTEANLNKMESKLGTEWRENITDMFDRMETGRTRSLKLDKGSAAMMNYLNGGIGTIMNFNTRSAVLQTISTTNFLNMRENNPIAAARAMGNVKQFAKDFKYIMNSDMLKQRRDGLAMNVTEAEIASAAASSQNPVQSIISKVLKAGYLPTKMADSFAISFGGATFYRNRIKMYEKQGMKTKEAEKQAFLDFQVIAERTQQSSRADLLSKQQTSLVGRFILPFANTPMQMNRAGMKDILDISKGRYKNSTEVAEKVGRISYYMGAQVAIFAGLQSALFAMLLNDDDVPEEKIANTKSMMLNTTADSMLRGFGVQGAVLSATKNALQEYFKQSAKPGFTADYSEVAEDLLNISPPIGSKFGMLDRAGDRKKWAKIRGNNEFKFELGNPSLEASLMTVQAVTNAPVYSPYQNLFNMQHALSDQYETWQRVLMGAGWTPYSVGIETEDKKKKSKEKGFNTKTFNKKTFKRKTFN